MQEAQHFKRHLERLGYSKNMILQLPVHIKDFIQFTAKPLDTVTSKDIVNFYHHLKERPNKRRTGGLSENYINHHIYALKLFFGWQQEKGVVIENPMSSLDFAAPTSQPRAVLTLEEIKTLYQVSETLKEKAVLSIFYGCGLRRSEGENLNLKDVHFRSGLLYVRDGKGNKRRVVPLNNRIVNDLKNYAHKERFAKQNETAFICNRLGTRTTGSSYNKILKTLLERTTIKKAITLHCLRHSIATHLLESGLSVEYVRDFLGHQHLESTQIYTRVKNKQLWNLQHT